MRNNEGLSFIASVHYYIRVLTQAKKTGKKTPEMKEINHISIIHK